MGTSAIHNTLSHTHTHTVQPPTRRKWLPLLLPSLPSPHAPRCPLCAPPADPPPALLQLRFSTSTRHRQRRRPPSQPRRVATFSLSLTSFQAVRWRARRLSTLARRSPSSLAGAMATSSSAAATSTRRPVASRSL